MTTRTSHTAIYLLLFFFAVYNSNWLNDIFYVYYNNMLLSLFIIVFAAVTGQWRQLLSYYSIKRITPRVLPFFFMVMAVIVGYRAAQFFLFKTEIRPGMIAVVRRNGAIFASPLLEDLFFIAIVFEAIRSSMLCRSPSPDEPRGQHAAASFLVPFLVTFYWFLLPHQYSNHFLDPGFSFIARIRDFPSDILFGLLCGVIVFVRSRSLILAGLCHYTYDVLVWLYVTYAFPVPP